MARWKSIFKSEKDAEQHLNECQKDNQDIACYIKPVIEQVKHYKIFPRFSKEKLHQLTDEEIRTAQILYNEPYSKE